MFAFLLRRDKGRPNGVASLDGAGLIPVSQLPSGATGKPQGFTPAGTWPTTYFGAAIVGGNKFFALAAGTMGAVTVDAGDEFVAKIDAPAQTDANWLVVEHNILTKQTRRLKMQPSLVLGADAAVLGSVGSMPAVLFNRNQRVRYACRATGEWDLSVDPIVRLQVASTVLPVVTLATVAWRAEVQYVAVGEQVDGAVAETISHTQTFTLFANRRQAERTFTLDKMLIADGDLILIDLWRMGTGEGDTYPDASQAAIFPEAEMQIYGTWGTV